ncbi:NAD-P-binding protein [Cantharellus anzutake]|uniref:NAD-P-binding protein n=1 Tax=Cantharellus anzutake TaxID=1750568 RepID=UPI001903B0CC|nr:NAD-P-binding protein [Cantharellus anzutake]KAF8326545.1 NAD-P-binding protein [Cantharellus anzutake]
MSYPTEQTLFFSSPEFAVVGASTVKEKYGTRVLKWYIDRNKTVTPVHPKEEVLEGINTVKTLSELPHPASTSVSIVTPPKVTLRLLEEGKKLGIPAFWLQPGAEDDAVRQYIEEGGLSSKVVLGGPCVLVDGDGVTRSLL